MLTIYELRQSTGLSQTEFSRKYHIPLSTIQHWEQEVRKCPTYVIELLEFRIRYEKERAL